MKHTNFLRTAVVTMLSLVIILIFSACSRNGDLSKTPDINQPINMVSGEYQFVVNSNNTVTITKYTGDGGYIEIPATIDGKKVTAIGNMTFGAFQDCTTLVSVVIPEGIISILDNTFYSCSNLKTVTIPASVTVIRHCAFADCHNLKSIYFEGDAPATGNYLLDPPLPTIYYHEGTEGWTNPWYGCITETY